MRNWCRGADSRFAPSQWETALLRNDVSHWLGANIESALCRVESSQYIPINMQVVHFSDVIMGTMASQITSLTIVYSTAYSGADQRKHQSSASLAFVWEIHRNSPHKWPVTRKMCLYDDVIIVCALVCVAVVKCGCILPIASMVTLLALGRSCQNKARQKRMQVL